MIEDFLYALSCKYIHKFSKKFEVALMVYSGSRGKLIHEKNQKSKISWHCPFKTRNPYSWVTHKKRSVVLLLIG